MPACAAEDDGQLWLRASASGELPGGWQVGLESVLRFGDEADGLYEGEYGGTIGRELSEGVSAAAGYLRVPSYSRDGVTRRENRFRQQLSFPVAHVMGGRLIGRFRIEERVVDTGNDLGVRLRPFLSWSSPIRSGSRTQVLLSHESFVNLNGTDWGQRGGYDRMRNFAGVTTPLAKRLALEIGYLNQYGFQRGEPDTQDHAASVGLSYRF
jgi:hypothetical protein